MGIALTGKVERTPMIRCPLALPALFGKKTWVQITFLSQEKEEIVLPFLYAMWILNGATCVCVCDRNQGGHLGIYVATLLALVLLFSARYWTSRNSGQMNKYLFFMCYIWCACQAYKYIWENRNTAVLLQCLLDSLQPQLSLNFFRFGTRRWQLKPGLVIRLLLIADILLLIFDRLLTVTIYQAGTFCAHVPSVNTPICSWALCKLSRRGTSFVWLVVFIWWGFFIIIFYFIPFVMWSMPFLLN